MKKIHVELEFLRLEFHHFIFLLLPHILQTQGSSLCRSEGPIVQSELQRSSFFLCSSFLFRSVLRLCSSSNLSSCSSSGLRSIVQSKLQRSSSFVLPLFIVLRHCSCSSSNRSSCSSSSLFFFKYQNRVSETRFCFLELKSIRLKIYLASYFQLTKWESSL